MCNLSIAANLSINLSAVQQWESEMNELNQLPVVLATQNYVRTEEDEKQDRLEREWKERRNQEAMNAFMRDNRSGRVVPRCE